MSEQPASAPIDRRTTRRAGGVADQWSAAQRDAWRLEGFKMQIAQEAQKRREAEGLRVAILIGVAVGVAGCGISFFTG